MLLQLFIQMLLLLLMEIILELVLASHCDAAFAGLPELLETIVPLAIITTPLTKDISIYP